MNDISVSVSYYINCIVGIFQNFFNTLDSIMFFGISLLDFNIAVVLISIIFPVILTLIKGSTSLDSRSNYSEKRTSERSANKNENSES